MTPALWLCFALAGCAAVILITAAIIDRRRDAARHQHPTGRPKP